MDFTTKFNAWVSLTESGLDRYVPAASARPQRLHQAMRYSLESGGKRLRPVLVLAATELFDPQLRADPLPAAVAVECVHTYSLIHDDLPCMDNDDLRRGRATAHRAFDEATALLAGDALLTHAFYLLATHYAARPAIATSLVADLGAAAGSLRLIGGQMEDLLAENRPDTHPADLDFIHLNKTSAMIESAVVMGARLGGAGDSEIESVRRAGRDLGLAFQIIDDILDATEPSTMLGKTAGKDAKAGKATYVSLYGLEKARGFAEEKSAAALEGWRALPCDTAFLVALTQWLTGRRK